VITALAAGAERERAVLLAGASGLIGRELLTLLRGSAGALHVVVRRAGAVPAAPPVHEHVVDFAALPALPAARDAYCALGTTIKTAGSEAAFRAVDFGAVLAFAQAAKAAQVERFAVVSALGAGVRSASFYNRVKGEMEDAVSALGFATLVIARPSLLAGDRAALGQAPRRAERLALKLTAPVAALIPLAWRPIAAATVARAMVRALAEARPGVRIVESAELQTLGGGTAS
jgi:uncharacterized protein YbjT (DUF2867 family)